MSEQLTREVIKVFGIDVFVAIQGASGESMKAVLMTNTRGICLVRSRAQKAFVMDNLTEFVKAHHLVTMTSAHIPKPEECVAWEKAMQTSRATPVAAIANATANASANVARPPVLAGIAAAALPDPPSSLATPMPPQAGTLVGVTAPPKVATTPSLALSCFGAGKL